MIGLDPRFRAAALLSSFVSLFALLGAAGGSGLSTPAAAAETGPVPRSAALTPRPASPGAPEPLIGPQETAPSGTEGATTVMTVEPATLVITNRPIVTFRAVMLGRSPRGRVEGAWARIEALLDRDIEAPVTSSRIPEGILISIGGEGVFVVTPADIDLEGGESIEQAGSEVVARLKQALSETVEFESGRRLIWAVGLTALATILFLVGIVAIVRVRRWLCVSLEEIAGRRVDAVRSRVSIPIDPQRIVAIVHGAVTVLAWLAGVMAAQIWLSFSLRQFPYTRPWGEDLGHYLVLLVERVGIAITHAIPGLLLVVIIALITRLLVRIAGEFFAKVEKEEIRVRWLHPDTAAPTRRITTAVLWLFALALAYPYLPGSESAAFKGISVFVGLVISLGSTSIVNQSASGLVLMYSRALRVGDYVSIGDVEGTVLSVGILSTKIRTTKQEEVNIPNSVLVSGTTKNYSRLSEETGVILYTSVTIGYNTPMRQVEALLLRAADRTSGLRKTPPPFVLQRALADFYVEYQLNARLESPETRHSVLSSLHANIQDEFNEHGVQIMSPHYMMDPARPMVVPKEDWYAAPASPPAEAALRKETSA